MTVSKHLVFHWNDEADVIARSPISSANAARELTEMFGRPFTRNMVIGRRKRLALPPRRPEDWGTRGWANGGTPRKPRSIPAPNPKSCPTYVYPDNFDPFNDTSEHAVPYGKLGAFQCKFPIQGHGEFMTCCGAPRFLGYRRGELYLYPYCGRHCDIAHQDWSKIHGLEGRLVEKVSLGQEGKEAAGEVRAPGGDYNGATAGGRPVFTYQDDTAVG